MGRQSARLLLLDFQWEIYVRHVVAPYGKIDHSSAISATLPAALGGEAEGLLQSFICRTVAVVRGVFAHGAGGFAAGGAGGEVADNVSCFDEHRAVRVRAISALADRHVELPLLLAKTGDEVVAEPSSDTLPGHWLATASRWVKGLISHGRAMELL